MRKHYTQLAPLATEIQPWIIIGAWKLPYPYQLVFLKDCSGACLISFTLFFPVAFTVVPEKLAVSR